jgi:hypothetical protein
MPTLGEIRAQLRREGVTDPEERNQRIAEAAKSGVATEALGGEPLAHQGPERTPAQNRAVFEGHQQELTDEEVARIWEEPTTDPIREQLMQAPAEAVHAQTMDIIGKMAQNYQTSPQYKQMLDQELAQIEEQISQLIQRRNMIQLAKQGQV